MDKELIKKVIIYTLTISTILAVGSYLIFKDILLASGFVIGSVTRLAGLNSIIKMTNKIDAVNNPKASGYSNYMIRLVFYGIVIWICLSRGVNIVTVIMGMMLMNLVIIGLNYKGGQSNAGE